MLNVADLPEEYQALRVPTTEFDSKAFLKKYLSSEGYQFLSEYAQKDYEERREYQDEQLQQLVLDHLSVFVQCKDAIEDVYNSDKQLFTGVAMSQIVDVFARFREQMIEPLLQPILTMDSETNALRNMQSIAVRNAAVLNLPFQALRKALEGDFDDCVQHLKSIVSFLDSSKFQRYSVMRISRRHRTATGDNNSSSTTNNNENNNNTASNNNNNNKNDGNNNTDDGGMFSNNNSFGGGGGTVMMDETYSQMSGETNNYSFASGATNSGGIFSSAAVNTTLQPFEVAHRLFSSWISAAEDTANFALFLARHELAGSFTAASLLTVNNSSSNHNNSNSIHKIGSLMMQQQNSNINTHQTTSASTKNSSDNAKKSTAGGGVRMVELEDLFFQILRLLDVLSIIRFERYRLLGTRSVEVSDAARQAHCTMTTTTSKMQTTTSTSSSSNPPPQQQQNQKQSESSNTNNTKLLQTSREIGIAKYLSAVIATSVKNPLMKKDANGTTASGKHETSPEQQLDNNNNMIPLPSSSNLIHQAKTFSQVFGDPKSQHPVLVYCHLFERSIHLNMAAAIAKLELEVRSVEVSAEQHMMKTSSYQKNSNSSWWSNFVPKSVSDIRLVSVALDHQRKRENEKNSNNTETDDPANPFSSNQQNDSNNKTSSRTLPNRTAILAKSLLLLREDGMSSSSSSSSRKRTPLSLSSSVLGRFVEPSQQQNNNHENNIDHDQHDQQQQPSDSGMGSSWLDGKSDEDAIWFANHCEENLQTFKSILSCLAPPSISTSSSSTSSFQHQQQSSSGTTTDPSSKKNSSGSDLSSSSSSSSLFSTRHKSMNMIVLHFSAILRDSLRSVSSAWKRLGPLLRSGSSLFREEQEWLVKAGVASARSAKNNNNDKNEGEADNNNNIDDELFSAGFDANRNYSNSNNNNDSNNNNNNNDNQEPDVDEFLTTAEKFKMLHQTSAMNSFNLSIPRRTINKLQEVCGDGFSSSDESKIIFDSQQSTSTTSASAFGCGMNSKKAVTLLAASCRLEMMNWMKIVGKFANALFRELLLSDIQGFFCSLGALKLSSSSSSSSSTAKTIEHELAITVRRWSGIFNEVIKNISELQRTISLDCYLSRKQDPFQQSNIVQTALLIPMSTSFTEALRRIFFISQSEIWSPKSPSWVLKEMERDDGEDSFSGTTNGSSSMFDGNNNNNSNSSSSSMMNQPATAGSPAFAERMESFVAEARQSLVNRFGEKKLQKEEAGSNNNVKTFDNNNICSEFTVSMIQVTSKMLTICAPLLRVVKKYDRDLCKLISGTIFDHLSILKQRVSFASLFAVKTTHPSALDAECATWLTFLSCAPFDCGASSSSLRFEVLRAFGGRANSNPQLPTNSSSSSSVRKSGNNNNNNNNNSNSSSTNDDFLSRTVSKELLGFLRCAVLEQSVADATSILNTAIPSLIAENVAATLTFKATSITDSSVGRRGSSSSSSPSSWLTQFFLYRKEGSDAASVDRSLKDNRQKFLSSLISNNNSKTSSSSSTTQQQALYSEMVRPEIVHLVEEVYEISCRQVHSLSSKATISALNAWFSQGVLKTTSNLDRALRYDNSNNSKNNNMQEISFSQYVASSTHGVHSSSIDLFPFIIETLLMSLRWTKRCENYYFNNNEQNCSSSSSVEVCWESVMSPILEWLTLYHYEHQQQECNEQEKSSALCWQRSCLDRLSGQLHHFIEKNFQPTTENGKRKSAAWLESLSSYSCTIKNLKNNLSNKHHSGDTSNFTACCQSSYSSLLENLTKSLDPLQHKIKIQKTNNRLFLMDQQQHHSNNNNNKSEFLPSETLDKFLSKDSPIEFAAWKRERGLEVKTDEQQEREDMRNNRFLSMISASTPENLDATGYISRNAMEQKPDPWWAVDSRGAERREIKLLERRGARVAAATNLLMNQQNANSFFASSSKSPQQQQQHGGKGDDSSEGDGGASDAGTESQQHHHRRRKLRKGGRKSKQQRTSFFTQKADEANKNAASAISGVLNEAGGGRKLFTSSNLGDRLSSLAGGGGGGLLASRNTRTTSNNNHAPKVEPLQRDDEADQLQQSAAGSRLQGLLANRTTTTTASTTTATSNPQQQQENDKPTANLFARKRHRR